MPAGSYECAGLIGQGGATVEDILLLAFAILVLRYGSHGFSSLAAALDQPGGAA